LCRREPQTTDVSHVSFACGTLDVGEITDPRGGMLLGSPARSSGEFGTKVRVSVLVGSQGHLPDVRNTQSDNLRVMAGVRIVREGPKSAYCLNAPKNLVLSGPKARTRSRDDIWSITSRRVSQKGSFAYHQNDVLETCPSFYFICQYQLTTIAFISSTYHPQPDRERCSTKAPKV